MIMMTAEFFALPPLYVPIVSAVVCWLSTVGRDVIWLQSSVVINLFCFFAHAWALFVRAYCVGVVCAIEGCFRSSTGLFCRIVTRR